MGACCTVQTNAKSEELLNECNENIEIIGTENTDKNSKMNVVPISDNQQNDHEATSQTLLAGDENKEIETDCSILLLRRQKLMDDGFCQWISDETYQELVTNLTSGYIRTYIGYNYQTQQQQFSLGTVLHSDVLVLIRKFYGISFGSFGNDDCVQLQCQQKLYRTTLTNISLSKVLVENIKELDFKQVIVKDIPTKTLEHVLLYLGHHAGVEPDELPTPVRSIHMSQICSDQWDADWANSFTKKTIFEIMLAANQLNIQSLVHLTCAKIATLIKQLDQGEINRIIEEEERYRREHANNNDNQSGQ